MLTITNTTKQKLPDQPFEKMADRVLGEKYDLSLAIVDVKEMKRLNFKYRNKNTATDILSFPLSESAGEIFICLSEVKKESTKFARSFDNFIAFLFIHGLTHLKGFNHSSTMEANEQIIRKEFSI